MLASGEAGGEVLLEIFRGDRARRPDRDDSRPRNLSAPLAVEEDVDSLPHDLQQSAALRCLGRGYYALRPVDARGQLRRRLAQGAQ